MKNRIYCIPVFNILEKNNLFVTLAHPKYTKPQKGNKTDCKDAKWICDLYIRHDRYGYGSMEYFIKAAKGVVK